MPVSGSYSDVGAVFKDHGWSGMLLHAGPHEPPAHPIPTTAGCAARSGALSLRPITRGGLLANCTSRVQRSALHPRPHLYQAPLFPQALEQPAPHLIQPLTHDEARSAIYGAPWPPIPGPPLPSPPPAKSTLTPLVDMVLAQQDSDHGQQLNDLILGYWWRYRFLATEPASEPLEFFSKQSVPCLLHADHGFWRFPVPAPPFKEGATNCDRETVHPMITHCASSARR